MRRRFILAAIAATIAATAWAQPAAYPNKAVTLVVPYAPGGLPDTISRIVGQKLSDKWGQPVVIDNRPGGNGVVAAQYVMARPADGYTLMATDLATFSINPFMYRSLTYAEKDFAFVSLTARAPLFLALHPSIPAATFPQFVALARANPGKYSYGSSGVGSIMQLVMESVKSTLGIDVLHVPFKGTGQSVPAAVSNQVSLVISAYPSLQGFAKDDKLRLIAVTTEKRSQLAPEVVPIAEARFPDSISRRTSGSQVLQGCPLPWWTRSRATLPRRCATGRPSSACAGWASTRWAAALASSPRSSPSTRRASRRS
jgi:tripartite-type tricarboxylate transporter receptor subunit TctC